MNPEDKRKSTGESPGDGQARHGSRTEVNWDGGRGREPYANQDPAASGPPNAGGEFAGGDRGELSGRNREQFEQAKADAAPAVQDRREGKA